jgi:biotin transporter BioY
VDLNQGLVDLVAVALVAALAPLIVAVLPGPRVPQVVILLIGGVLIGPHVLGVLSVLVFPLVAVMLHRSAPITPADMGIGTAEAAARTGTPPDDPGQPASQDG